ncbi:hypothetical protein F5B22DRAFT_649769 [Xylaria bambusicola]|uniref:uncharacterized protein n=1 Tax=Xylaria bambusicola TaxID=326684 RepID=UPI0020088AA1|nr:uncharacterized protein F5B22DRAFT_649769 [Xylaria bambusicola]KAI0508674.1 hypothetical protein F5B22DRAFT_649769 [Xylaria bambusicola]
MKYALPLLALVAAVYAAPQNLNETGKPEEPAPEIYPVPWPHPEIPEGGSIGIPTIPAEPTHQEPVPACTAEPHHGGEQPSKGEPHQGGPHYDEPHPAQPHHGPGFFPPHQVAGNDATGARHSLAALAIGIAAAVGFSL